MSGPADVQQHQGNLVVSLDSRGAAASVTILVTEDLARGRE